MGDFFKKLDEIMTGDLVRKIGGAICVIALILIGAGFLVGAKSVLSTMKKGSGTAVVATDEEAAEQEEATSEDVEEDDNEGEEEEDEY